MYRQLTIDHCLYTIDQSILDIFLRLAKRYVVEEDVSIPLSMDQIDNWAVVLQIWCLFNEDEHRNFVNPEKTMAYACNYYCLHLLRSDKSITSFLKTHIHNDATKYVLSYYLSYYLLQWVYELMNEEQEHKDIIASNLERNYFLLSEEENLIHNEQHLFYKQQQHVTQLLATDFQATSRYANYIKSSLRQTTIYLQKLTI